MILLVAATEIELLPIKEKLNNSPEIDFLISGVGVLETTYTLSTALKKYPASTLVINVGIAGGYFNQGVAPLDICIAESETLADFGIIYQEKVVDFDSPHITTINNYPTEKFYLDKCCDWFKLHEIPFKLGNFNTVAGTSATKDRGDMLALKNKAICENMEGAALAMVCQKMAFPWLEVRTISNMVEDRNIANWQIKEACTKGATLIADLCQVLNKTSKLT